MIPRPENDQRPYNGIRINGFLDFTALKHSWQMTTLSQEPKQNSDGLRHHPRCA